MSARETCETCSALLPLDQPGAFICSHGCTYCRSCCVHSLLGICPNCQGELVPRARRFTAEALTDYATNFATLVRPALPGDLTQLLPLFVAYRVFYGELTNEISSAEFLRARLALRDSLILLAFKQHVGVEGVAKAKQIAVGFTQLYPIFSSVSARRSYLLNDLFVDPNARRQGIAESLLSAAHQHAKQQGAVWLTLQTAHSNLAAQRLYQRSGWQLDAEFQTYVQHIPMEL
jgi:GNAT superfamily N-acetyltransferase